jgi:hexose kinase, 1-phosphofructokinase family
MILSLCLNPSIDKVYYVNSFEPGHVFMENGRSYTTGGRGIIVAKVIKILGGNVMASGFLGGRSGDDIKDELTRLGIHQDFIGIRGESRSCTIIIDSRHSTSTSVLERGPRIYKVEKDAFIRKYKELLGISSTVAMAGSLPPGMEPSFYRPLIDMARANNVKVLLDTRGTPLKIGAEAKPFMIKPNIDEAQVLSSKPLSTDSDVVDLVVEMSKKGIDIACVTMGERGCIACINNRVYKFTIPKIEIVNDVGAGDAFAAGCANYIDMGRNPLDIIINGVACGMAKTQFIETGRLTPELVEKYKEMISIVEM